MSSHGSRGDGCASDTTAPPSLSLPLAAFAEDYIITPTSGSTCELGWHYAYEWAGPAERVLGRFFGAAFALGARRDLEKLARPIQSDDW